jgi:hypothetical protein
VPGTPSGQVAGVSQTPSGTLPAPTGAQLHLLLHTEWASSISYEEDPLHWCWELWGHQWKGTSDSKARVPAADLGSVSSACRHQLHGLPVR